MLEIGFIIEFVLITVTIAEAEVDLATYVTPGGYAVIVIAVLIGLGIIAALVFVIIRGRKARIAGVYPHPSTSGQKQSTLDFNKATASSRGKYFKSSRKTDSKTKGSHKSSPVQRSFKSDEEKRLFKKDESLSNTSTLISEYDLEKQPTHVVGKNNYLLKKFFSKHTTNVNALGRFSNTRNPQKPGLNAYGNTRSPMGESRKSSESSNQDKERISEKCKNDSSSTIGNSSRTSNSFRGSRMRNTLSNVDAKNPIQLTGNASVKSSQSGWDVASRKFGQSVQMERKNKRIVGGMPTAVQDRLNKDEMQKGQMQKDVANLVKKESTQKNFGVTTTRDRNLWTNKHIKKLDKVMACK